MNECNYVFGTVKYNGINCLNLKTIGSKHTDLKGMQQVNRVFTDAIITDSFRVLKKYRSDEDPSGKCYDWYLIDEHYRDTDKFTPAQGEINSKIEDLEIASCEMSADASARLEDIELALCELSEGM